MPPAGPSIAPAAIAGVRAELTGVVVSDAVIASLSQACLALGLDSLRPAIFAARACRALAALDGADETDESHALVAARLVLAHRAQSLPEIPDAAEAAEPGNDDGGEDMQSPASETQALTQMIVDAAVSALPAGLLERLERSAANPSSPRSGSGSAAKRKGFGRGRPAGARPGVPGGKARLNLVETLRAASPWQFLRKRVQGGVIVRREDFRITRYKQRHETTAIFAVDASGSAAAQRMAEAKGGVEILLADSYVRRDRVALIAFRGKSAELLLPPTRSLQRARRALADLPGGGGTPLADAILQAVTVAEQVRRSGGTPLIVFLTDGRANVARDGSSDRVRVQGEVEEAARLLGSQGHRALLIDISATPRDTGRNLAAKMKAHYLPLPHAGAAAISGHVARAIEAG